MLLINKTTLVPFAALSSFGWQFLLTDCSRSVMHLAAAWEGRSRAPGRVGDTPRAAAAHCSKHKNIYKECISELYAIYHKWEGWKEQE